MKSQIKFMAKGLSLIIFWLLVIAASVTLFSCEPYTVCGEITNQYQKVDRTIIFVINGVEHEVSEELATKHTIGDNVCIDLN